MDHARLDGRYALERLIERGASAEVWLARDERLGRSVAIKLATSPAAEGYREALAVGSLAHPHIVAVHDAGLHDGRPFIVMDYLEGGSLRARLASGALPEADVARIGTEVARALAFAHQHGLVHNDVKPENILFDASGAARLADFGVATIPTQTLTPDQARHFAGTVAYLAPEILSGEPASQSSDLYSLALTLVEALTGHLPQRGTVIRPQDIPSSPGLAAALAIALDPWPVRRHPDAASFARALEAVPTGPTTVPAATAPPTPRSALAAATPVRIGPRPEAPRPPAAPPPPNRRGAAIAVLSVAVLAPLLAAAIALGAFDRTSAPNGDLAGLVTTSATDTPEPAPTALPTATATPEPTAESEPPPRGRDKPKPDNPGRGNDDDDDEDDDNGRASIITITLD